MAVLLNAKCSIENVAYPAIVSYSAYLIHIRKASSVRTETLSGENTSSHSK